MVPGGFFMAYHPLTNEQQAIVDGYHSSRLTIKEYASSIGLKEHQVGYLLNKDRLIRGEQIYNKNKENGFIPLPYIGKNNKDNDINSDTINIETISSSNNVNKLISFKLNNFNIIIDKNDLKTFLEALNND